MIHYMSKGMRRDTALGIAGVSKHALYHKPKENKVGRRKTDTTKMFTSEGIKEVSNELVVTQIKEFNADPDLRCGYKRMTGMLGLCGYFVNKKKVHRLMSENGMLNPAKKSTSRTFAKYRIVTPEVPLEVIEMDIKHIWIESERRSAYVLTVIDTFTRYVLGWQVGFTMKSHQVETLWNQVIEQHLESNSMRKKHISIEVRNDNGPQFKSDLIRAFFNENYLNQVFTHPYTPQENGHIESFHCILSNALDPAFWSLRELETRLNRFYEAYNTVRVHGSICMLSPQLFWSAWNYNLIERNVSAKRKVTFKLKCPIQQIPGIISQRETSCIKTSAKHTNVHGNDEDQIIVSAISETPVNQSPSVTSCLANKRREIMLN